MNMQHSPGEVGDSLRERALRAGLVRLECGACSEQAWVTDPRAVAALVEHCAFGHVRRESIIGIQTTELVSNYMLARKLGTPPQTDHEQAWRDSVDAEHEPLTIDEHARKVQAAEILERMLTLTKAHNSAMAGLATELERIES